LLRKNGGEERRQGKDRKREAESAAVFRAVVYPDAAALLGNQLSANIQTESQPLPSPVRPGNLVQALENSFAKLRTDARSRVRNSELQHLRLSWNGPCL